MWFKKKENCCSKTASDSKITIHKKGIYVLGTGCTKCNLLEENMKQALTNLNIKEEIFHITDFDTIIKMGIISTPALIIDYKVVSSGNVLNKDECISLIKKQRNLQ